MFKKMMFFIALVAIVFAALDPFGTKIGDTVYIKSTVHTVAPFYSNGDSCNFIAEETGEITRSTVIHDIPAWEIKTPTCVGVISKTSPAIEIRR